MNNVKKNLECIFLGGVANGSITIGVAKLVSAPIVGFLQASVLGGVATGTALVVNKWMTQQGCHFILNWAITAVASGAIAYGTNAAAISLGFIAMPISLPSTIILAIASVAVVGLKVYNQHAETAGRAILSSTLHKNFCDSLPEKIKNQKQHLESLSTEKLLGLAKEKAVRFNSSEMAWPSPQVVCQHLDTLKNNMQSKSEKDLRQIYEPYLDQINVLKEICSKEFSEDNAVKAVGRDSVNRWYVTNESTIQKLCRVEILNAIIALKVSSRQDLILVNRKYELNLYSMLYNGFKSNTYKALESLPLNSEQLIERNEENQRKHLIEYLRRKNIETTFVPIIKALLLLTPSHHQYPVLEKAIRGSIGESLKLLFTWASNTYYPELSNAEKEKFVTNAGDFTLEELEMQSIEGVETYCKASGVKTVTPIYKPGEEPISYVPDFTVQSNFLEFIDFISKSDAILNPSVSHNVDRLHLITSFLSNQNYCIKFLDGGHSVREIYRNLIKKLIKDNSSKTALAAEQFYIRLLMMNR